MISSVAANTTNFSGIAFSNDLSIMFVGAAKNGMLVYNTSNFNAPYLISSYQPLDPTYYVN